MLVPNRRFGTIYRSYFQGSSSPREMTTSSSKMEQIRCFETSVRNYLSASRKIPNISNLSRKVFFFTNIKFPLCTSLTYLQLLSMTEVTLCNQVSPNWKMLFFTKNKTNFCYCLHHVNILDMLQETKDYEQCLLNQSPLDFSGHRAIRTLTWRNSANNTGLLGKKIVEATSLWQGLCLCN